MLLSYQKQRWNENIHANPVSRTILKKRPRTKEGLKSYLQSRPLVYSSVSIAKRSTVGIAEC